MTITLIMAADDNGAIGYKGGLPWPKDTCDMLSFIRHTYGKKCLMSESVFDSIASRISHRGITIVTRDIDWEMYGSSAQEYMLLGGAKVYESALPFVTEFVIHRINGKYKADTYTPFPLPWIKK